MKYYAELHSKYKGVFWCVDIEQLEITEQAEIYLPDESYLQITYATENFETYIVVEIDSDKLIFIEVEFQNYDYQ